MSQEAQQNQDTKSGTSTNLETSQKATGKRGRPAKVEEPDLPDGVLGSIDKLEFAVSQAKLDGQTMMLCTADVLKRILLKKYDEEKTYSVTYKDVRLVDHTKQAKLEEESQNYLRRVFK